MGYSRCNGLMMPLALRMLVVGESTQYCSVLSLCPARGAYRLGYPHEPRPLDEKARSP